MMILQILCRLSCWGLFVLLVSMYGAPGCDALLDNKGKEFILGFMPNIENGAVELHLTAEVTAVVEIEYPVGTSIEKRTVTPGTIEIVLLRLETSTSWVADDVLANLVRASSEHEFVVYMVNRAEFTTDAALGLPIDTMNTEYIVVDYIVVDYNVEAQFLIYAAFDDTIVTITPSKDVVGHSAGEPFSVKLDRGEGYYARSAVSLTGTTISSTRPVGMVNGNVCTNVPSGTPACDHLFEVAQPVQTWGVEIGVANLPQREGGSIYRVIASQDNTEVTLDGTTLANLNAGDFFETAIINGNHVFCGDNPIFVTQYMTGQNAAYADRGDPSMGNMIPFAQYLSEYTFSTVGGEQFEVHYVTIIARNDDIGYIKLDENVVPSSEFSAILGTDYSAAIVSIEEGTHSTTSSNPHGITVEGYNEYDSYLYPGGALFQFINPIDDLLPPILTLEPPIDGGGVWSGQAVDNRKDDTGIFFIELSPDSFNLEMIAYFTPGDPVVNLIVQPVDTARADTIIVSFGDVIATDGAGNKSTIPVNITKDPKISKFKKSNKKDSKSSKFKSSKSSKS